MDIKILGTGCAKCNKVEQMVKDIVSEEGVEASVEKITDIMKIAGYGVLTTPAVIIDGEVKSAGKVPHKKDIIKWLAK